MSQTAALLTRKTTDPVAFVTQKLATLNGYTGVIHGDIFLSHVISLAQQLPKKSHIVNLCGNRYLFMVSICAAVLRKQINLLPPNKNTATQRRLAQRYQDTYVLHDGIDVEDGLEEVNLAELSFATNQFDSSIDQIPQIALTQLALISFTSGSTGDSKPNLKTWQTLTASTAINRRYMLPDLETTYSVLATVPGQHMWGLETSVLMALFSCACIVDSKPLFPADIHAALSSLPAPRAIVSTPVHLRALAESDLDFSKSDIVLCATSPLTAELAKKIEQQFDAQLHEVYGCSEVGSMALRKTAKEETWLKFDGINFTTNDDKTIASTDYLPEKVELSDKIALDENNRFRLLGRSSDMVDIAGKRGSLTEINKILLQFEGIWDGVVLFPEQNRAIPRLVAIVVLKENYTKAQLKSHFGKYLDNAFIPRPIFNVEQLPREENGKLPRKKVDKLYAALTV